MVNLFRPWPLALYRINNDLLYIASDVRRIAVTKVGSLNQQNDEQVLDGIDPGLSSKSAAVSVCSSGHHRMHPFRLPGDLPAKSHPHTRRETRKQIARLVPCHFGDAFLRHDPHFANGAAQ